MKNDCKKHNAGKKGTRIHIIQFEIACGNDNNWILSCDDGNRLTRIQRELLILADYI